MNDMPMLAKLFSEMVKLAIKNPGQKLYADTSKLSRNLVALKYTSLHSSSETYLPAGILRARTDTVSGERSNG